MTEKQYEDLMFALSTLIALEKKKHMVQPITGVPYHEILRRAEEQFQKETETVYKDLTGSPSGRKVTHSDIVQKLQETDRKVKEQMEVKLAEQAKREEEEKAKQAEKDELERIRQEELAKRREACRVTDTDFLRGGTK